MNLQIEFAEGGVTSKERARRTLRLCLISSIVSMLLTPVLRSTSSSMDLLVPLAGSLAILATYSISRFAFYPLLDQIQDRSTQLSERNDDQDFRARLTRALERSKSDAEVLVVAMRATSFIDPQLPAEVMLADSSRSHLRRAAETGPGDTGPRCQVTDPWECPALSGSQSHLFDRSDRLDACPHLRQRQDERGQVLTAGCFPMGSRGQVLGVLHVARPAKQPLESKEWERLELIASRTGFTLGVARAFATSQLQASTDPLTGLLNRRSFEDRCRLHLQDNRYCLLAMDLDNFKALNDLHGHAAGDRALRAFADVLRGCAGPADIVARLGGEEFVLVSPQGSAQDAMRTADKIHHELLSKVAASETAFTVSLGIANGRPAEPVEQTLARADQALFAAKRAGRNRTETANFDGTLVRDKPDIPAPRPSASESTELDPNPSLTAG